MLTTAAEGRGTTSFNASDCSAVGQVARHVGRPHSQAEPTNRDMSGVSELMPRGAIMADGRPFDWAIHPRVGRGNNPRLGWTQILPWGQIYVASNRSIIENTVVEIRNLRIFIRPKETGVWCRLGTAVTPTGGFFPQDFRGAPVKGNQRASSSGGILISPLLDRAFHFYTPTRFPIPASGMMGVYADFEARLLRGNVALPDDRSQAAIVASAGIDYWKDSGAAQAGQLTNEDAAIGRFRRITSKWKVFSVNTLGARRNAAID